MMHILKTKSIFLVLISLFPVKGYSNKKLTENYVSIYKNIAVSEMRRTGIPASIKLAQGILESDLGRSPLAYKANNHFGIKCGSEWNGDIFYKQDDDKDSNGSIIESCFRSFSNSEESYIAHSEFLTNPSKQSRYGFLFDLSTKDYVGWANGLKFSGYATDPDYPSKLIKIIESNQLYLLDEQINEATLNDIVKSDNKDQTSNKSTDIQIVKANQEHSEKFDNRPSKKYYTSKSNSRSTKINDLKVIYASGDETLKSIAMKKGIDVYELMEYNENLSSQFIFPVKGQIIFLEKKKKSYSDDSQPYHTVVDGEDMYSISQKYGIRLESLLAKNNLNKDAIPLAGESISLQKNLSKKETPKHRFIEKFDSFVDLGGLK